MRVPSVIFQGHRIRAIFGDVVARPDNETFPEFLFRYIMPQTLGEAWWRRNIERPPSRRHAIAQWFQALQRSLEEGTPAEGGLQRTTPTGPAWEYIQLGYDFFCLQEHNRLPAHLVERIRQRGAFQGARYEVCAAAILCRAGFVDFEFLDDRDIKEQHCEFYATEPHTRTRVAVEAKSRHRPGVHNFDGSPREYTGDFEGVQKLYRRALEKRPAGLPLIVFLDMNVPKTPTLPDLFQKPWHKDLQRVVGAQPVGTPEQPDPVSAVFATNFSNHYESDRPQPPEVVFVVPQHSVRPIHGSVIERIMRVAERYHSIPAQL